MPPSMAGLDNFFKKDLNLNLCFEGLCHFRHAPLLMEWALLEAEEGKDAMARELFSQGAAAGQPHLPLLSAWASFEEQRGRCAHMPDTSSKKSLRYLEMFVLSMHSYSQWDSPSSLLWHLHCYFELFLHSRSLLL